MTEHESTVQRITCASAKCNSITEKCPVQYRIIHCNHTGVWWLQELEVWWKGPDGLDSHPVHNDIRPDAVDRTPIMHSQYKKTLNLLYSEDPRRPKHLVNLIATKPYLIMLVYLFDFI